MSDLSMTDAGRPDPPSPFIVDALRQRLAAGHTGKALDVAAGRGRHAAALARAGFKTIAVERRWDILRAAVSDMRTRGLSVHGWCADLTMTPLPSSYFEVIVVTRYLQRDLCPAIAAALAPGGVLLYETFTEAQRGYGRGPTSPDHLLAPGELPTLFAGLVCERYEEVATPDAVARLVARAPSRRS